MVLLTGMALCARSIVNATVVSLLAGCVFYRSCQLEDPQWRARRCHGVTATDGCQAALVFSSFFGFAALEAPCLAASLSWLALYGL